MPDVLGELRRRRGPITRILIGLVIAWALLGVARIVLDAWQGMAMAEAAARHAGDIVSVPVLLVLVLVLVADEWVRPRVPEVGRLSLIATVTAAAAVAVGLVIGAIGLGMSGQTGAERALGVANLLVGAVVPIILCVAMGWITRAVRRATGTADRELDAGRTEALGPGDTADRSGTGSEGSEDSAAVGGPEGSADEVPGAAGSGHGDVPAGTKAEPTPDPTAGAAWTSAAEAARGGGASRWGAPGAESHGWRTGTTGPNGTPELGGGGPVAGHHGDDGHGEAGHGDDDLGPDAPFGGRD